MTGSFYSGAEMKVLSVMTIMLLIIMLSSVAAVRAEDDSAGGNNEPVTEQVDPATPKPDQKTEPKPETKPATGAAEPGCN
jgi:hypothetical protein